MFGRDFWRSSEQTPCSKEDKCQNLIRFAFSVPELHDVHSSLFLQPVVVPLKSSPALQCVDCSPLIVFSTQNLSVSFCWPGEDDPFHPKTWTTTFSLCAEAPVCWEGLLQPGLGTILSDMASLYQLFLPSVSGPSTISGTFMLTTESLAGSDPWLVPCCLCSENLLRYLLLRSLVSTAALATPAEKNWPPSCLENLTNTLLHRLIDH